MRQPVIGVLEVAEATNKTGELTVALFAGVDTVTLTDANANIGREITHASKGDFHRITRFSSKRAVRSGGGLSGSTAHQAEDYARPARLAAQAQESNEGDNPVTPFFLT